GEPLDQNGDLGRRRRFGSWFGAGFERNRAFTRGRRSRSERSTWRCSVIRERKGLYAAKFLLPWRLASRGVAPRRARPSFEESSLFLLTVGRAPRRLPLRQARRSGASLGRSVPLPRAPSLC